MCEDKIRKQLSNDVFLFVIHKPTTLCGQQRLRRYGQLRMWLGGFSPLVFVGRYSFCSEQPSRLMPPSRRLTCFCHSASLWPDIPLAATLCNPKLWSFPTRFRLNSFRPPASADGGRPSRLSLEPDAAASRLERGVCWERGAAEMPRSCSSCRSPSDEVVTCAEVVLLVLMSGPACWWWDAEGVLRSWLSRPGGRL